MPQRGFKDGRDWSCCLHALISFHFLPFLSWLCSYFSILGLTYFVFFFWLSYLKINITTSIKTLLKNAQTPEPSSYPITTLAFMSAWPLAPSSCCACIHFIEMCPQWTWDFFFPLLQIFTQTFSFVVPVFPSFPGGFRLPLSSPWLSHCPIHRSTPQACLCERGLFLCRKSTLARCGCPYTDLIRGK